MPKVPKYCRSQGDDGINSQSPWVSLSLIPQNLLGAFTGALASLSSLQCLTLLLICSTDKLSVLKSNKLELVFQPQCTHLLWPLNQILFCNKREDIGT